MSNLITVTAANFKEEVLDSDIPVLIDFWAPWCKPCLAIVPSLEEIAEQFKGKIKFCKLDVDGKGAGEITTSLQVRGIPTLMILKKGVILDRATGSIGAEKLKLVTMLNNSLE